MVERRAFIGAALFACAFPEQLLKAMPQEEAPSQDNKIVPDDTPIDDPEKAKSLLKYKVHQVIFDDHTVIRNIYRFIRDLDVRYGGIPVGWIHIPIIQDRLAEALGVDKQIDNAIDEFKLNNPWDNNKTRYEKMTVGSARRRYVDRFTRQMHQLEGPRYQQTLELPLDQRKEKLERDFGKFELLFGCSPDRQLGRARFDDQGNFIGIDEKWHEKPLWERPKLNLAHIVKRLGARSSPFVYTISDLRAVGILVNYKSPRPPTAAAAFQATEKTPTLQ